MKSKYIKLARQQLDEAVGKFSMLKTASIPFKGWIRAVRDVLGMTGEQLAKRLNVNKQRVSRMEHDEVSGNITVESLRKAATALDCVFVYGFVPQTSFEDIVRKQAAKLALKRFSQSNQMMRLEKQELSESEKAEVLENLINQIIQTMPKSLWDNL